MVVVVAQLIGRGQYCAVGVLFSEYQPWVEEEEVLYLSWIGEVKVLYLLWLVVLEVLILGVGAAL